jgi:hypothetical protein
VVVSTSLCGQFATILRDGRAKTPAFCFAGELIKAEA